jgi:hypothetical protein
VRRLAQFCLDHREGSGRGCRTDRAHPA